VSQAPACVLTLHRIREERERDHDLSRASFERLLRLLRRVDGDFNADLRRPLAATVVLTFDDGTADHLRVARQLADFGAPAIFFVPSDRIGRQAHLTEEDLRELERLGHRIGSHAVRHVRLEGLSLDELRQEVVESKRRLERIVRHPVTFFAAPGGSRHPALAKELEQAGYEAARSTRWGLYDREDERWHVPSIPVTELTLRNGWVTSILDDRRMPRSMRWTGAARRFLPPRVARIARGRVHARFD
jgi:peptidoglycan/xylan/chitin deacetylase (PgdA/CDA1 family)